MANIVKREQKNGSVSFQVKIRRKNMEVIKTFSNREDAELFAYYRERLIENMKAYDISMKDRLTLQQICELKQKTMTERRAIAEFENSCSRIMENIKPHAFLGQLTYEDWEECLYKINNLSIPMRGGAKIMTIISPISVRRIFATLSSAFSHAIGLGIPLENYPLKLIQNKINPALKKGDKVL